MKKIFKDYFTFSKRDRIAVIIILFIIGVFAILPYFFSVKKKKTLVDEKLQQQITQLQQNKPKSNYNKQDAEDNNWQPYAPQSNNNNEAYTKGEVFEFNPNTLDANGWKRLGIREKTINTIFNYLNKGGKFRTPEDIRKIWGLRKEDADRIIPYAKIEGEKSNNYYKNNYSKVTTPPSLLDANTATAQDLKNLPGIGSSLPYKIINFREKLGGFLNMVQIKETYGMTDSVFQSILPYLHVLPTEIKKLNINTASEYDLNAHPYIDKTVAKAITIYRSQHGGYVSVNDVKKIVFITQEVFNKIAPYLSVGN